MYARGVRRIAYLLAAACISSSTYAQSRQASPAKEKFTVPAFEVASVKLANPDEHMQIMPTGDGFTARRVLIAQLIWFAYRSSDASDAGHGIIKSEQIAGLPGWTTKSRYDIEAKLPPEMLPSFQKLRAEQRREVLQQMLATLLADRFKLRIHFKSTEKAVYALIVKNSSKLKPLSSTDLCLMNWGNDFLDFRNCTIDQFAMNLSTNEDVGRIVINRTGLAGVYDLRVKWTPYEEEPSGGAPSLFSAIEEQFGLKLVSANAPVNTLVVDSIEAPSPN
jgi:uncharacterized protein (TIGR03435 family)